MNVKKMFAATAGMLIVASSLPVSVLGAASYSDELQGAYNYAYSKGITTMSSIDNANMYGELTRGQLAKMISNWAEKELGTKADETKVCSFADAQTAEGDLAAYVKKACQMGLMGQGITSFRPNDKVTRGEFGTTLSRAIWGTKYDGATPYYANHLQALKDKGIMTKIENPSQMEIRGYVMLMLQRTSEKEISNAKCNDPVTVLACTMGTTSCPAECKKTVNTGDVVNTGTDVKAGNLELDVQKVSNGVVSVPANGVISMGDVKLAANGADITLRGVTLERIGLGNNTSVKGVWFEKNGVRVTNKGYLSSDSRTSVSFNPALVVKSTDTLELVVELKGDTGAEHAFKITGVESSAANLNVKNNTTVTVRTTDYKVASVNVAYKNVSREYNMEENKSYELAKINIENVSNINQKSVVVKSMLLRNEKNGDVNNLYDVVLYRNGKKVSDKVEMVGSRELLVTLKDTISSAQTANYSLEAKVKGVDSAEGDTYLFDLRRGEDMTAVEDSTNFRSAVKLGSLDATKFYTIKGGKILFTTASNLPRTETVVAESSDVVLMKGTVNPKEPVILRDLKLTLTYGGTPAMNSSSISKIQAKIGNTVINGSFVQDTSDARAKEIKLLQCVVAELVA